MGRYSNSTAERTIPQDGSWGKNSIRQQYGAASKSPDQAWISEAARRLPASLRDRHPELPWRAIMGVGNVYRHDYDNLAEEFVWRTVNQSLSRRC
jgi:Protein of unknown function DUF86